MSELRVERWVVEREFAMLQTQNTDGSWRNDHYIDCETPGWAKKVVAGMNALLPEEREPTSEDALLLYLQGKPLANGDWPHLLWCSGDRSKPPGSRGVTCCCKPPVPEEREPVMVCDRCGNPNLVRLTDE